MEHILNLEQVKKYYGGNSGNITKAVDGISMYVDKGEFVAIMGASGSGKTKEELLEKLWNDKYYLDENVLLVNMTRLKKKMKEIGIVHLLENIRGKGWKL